MPKAPHHLAVPAAAEPHPEHLLLALIRQQRTPANVAAVARLFGVTRPTIRRWRDRLLAADLIAENGTTGYWTITPRRSHGGKPSRCS
jgi:DNA-binding IclR family transcriptional regulator